MVWSRFKSPFRNPGKREKKCESSSRNKSNVNEEYMEAFRTKSYVEMCNKVQSQLGISKSLDDVGPSSSTSYSLHHHVHLSNGLLEPQQETLVDVIRDSNFHQLIMDYFEVGSGACKLCEELLQIVHQTRSNHRVIKRVVKLAKRVNDSSTDNNAKNQCVNGITVELASYSLLKNPLSSFSPAKFHDTQYAHGLLFKKLTSKYRRIRRRIKFIQSFKKVMGCTLVVSCTALAIALLVLAFHSMVGIMASPSLIGCSIGLIKKHGKLAKKSVKTEELERLGTQLDVAARGVYTLINDFDTMSRLGWRLYDEIEHGKAIADMCVRNGKGEVIKEVVREFQSHESCFLELLEEFEEHIYLCLLNVNRSRRQLVEEILVFH